ncbi:CAP domain-containing protein [Neobacillus niacini]|uniref:CAP domain-containing protein n=1 Tax=Neobacillus niacini TaxID=86668 RepID=UPI002FFE3198
MNTTNDALNISADRTTLDSKSYPHTKAILIQHAQYRYIPFGSVQWYQFGGNQQGQTPNQQQGPVTPTPAPVAPTPGPAPAPVAPTAPAPTAPAPTAPAPAAPAPTAPAPKPAAPTPKTAAPTPATGDVSQYVKQVIDLTNAQRSKNGLPALKSDSQLSGVAQKKSVDMQQNNYFSHTSPTYGSPFDMMRDFGVTYKSAGENIAQGQRTPQEVVNAWMNSEGHRKNILSANFTHIGVGYEKAGNHWTQMFIGK